MQRASEVIGRPVVTSATGERVGTANDLLLSRDGDRVVAVVIGGGVLGNERGVLPFEQVQTFGRDVIVATIADAVIDGERWQARHVDVIGPDAVIVPPHHADDDQDQPDGDAGAVRPAGGLGGGHAA